MEPHGQSPWHLTNAQPGRHPPPDVGTGRPEVGAFSHGQRPWSSTAGVTVDPRYTDKVAITPIESNILTESPLTPLFQRGEPIVIALCKRGIEGHFNRGIDRLCFVALLYREFKSKGLFSLNWGIREEDVKIRIELTDGVKCHGDFFLKS